MWAANVGEKCRRFEERKKQARVNLEEIKLYVVPTLMLAMDIN